MGSKFPSQKEDLFARIHVLMCILSSIFDFYIHKYVYFSGTIQNCLDRLTQFKHRLNSLNSKQKVTDCLPFSVSDSTADSYAQCPILNLIR